MPPITPCLWFDHGEHARAVAFYCTVFPGARRLDRDSSDATDDEPVVIPFELDGRPFQALGGGPEFRPTPAFSLSVSVGGQDELDRYWDALVEGGAPGRCGWLTDRFGLSWQIVPTRLGELLGDPDPDRARRALEQMLTMDKLDLAPLEAAADG